VAKLNKIDVLAGLFVILIGVLSVMESLNFNMGTTRNMGPGYFPYYIGIFMLIVGVGIVLEGFRPALEGQVFGQLPSIRGLLMILAGVIGFALTIQRFGLAPATAIAVFLGTMADDSTPILQKVILTIAVPIVSVLIFKYGLGMNADVFRWRP
jgi:hypothetical protein